MDSMETALKSLERYHAAEAAGLLLRLPVPLGTRVWRVQHNPACHQYEQPAKDLSSTKIH